MTLQAVALTVLLCILFGSNSVAIKLALEGLGPFTTAGTRFTIAVFAIFMWARFKQIPLSLTQKQWGQMVVLSLIFTCQLSLFYHGLVKTSASHGVLISNLLPLMVMVLAHLFIPGDTITVRKSMGILLGFIGVMFLFFDDPGLTGNYQKGDAMILAAVCLWSCNSVFVKRIIADYHPVQITLYPMIFSIPLFFASGFFWDDPMIKTVDPAIIGAILYQAIITASFGFIMWNTLLQEHGATTMHSFIFIMPLAGVFFGVWILDEVFTRYLMASIVCIVMGIMIANSRPGTFKLRR